MGLKEGIDMLKVLGLLILSVFTVCISGCNDTKNRDDTAVEVATDEVSKENVAVTPPVAQVAKVEPPEKSETRPLRPIGKRTAPVLKDGDSVAGTEIVILENITAKRLEHSDVP